MCNESLTIINDIVLTANKSTFTLKLLRMIKLKLLKTFLVVT